VCVPLQISYNADTQNAEACCTFNFDLTDKKLIWAGLGQRTKKQQLPHQMQHQLPRQILLLQQFTLNQSIYFVNCEKQNNDKVN